MPDDIGKRGQSPPGQNPPGQDRAARTVRDSEPADLTWLYEHEPPPGTWRIEPAPKAKPEPGPAEPAPEADAEDAGEREESLVKRATHRRRWLVVGILGGGVLLIAATIFGWYWFTTLRWLEATDDAYTQADNTIIAPKVAGYVKELLVTDNQVVQPGEVLLRIDPRDYQAAVSQAEADVASAEADIRNIEAKTAAQQAVIDQAKADIAAAQGNLVFSQQEYARYAQLVRTGAGTVQRAQQAAADLRDKTASLQHNRGTLDQAEKQIAVLETQRAVAEATLQHAVRRSSWRASTSATRRSPRRSRAPSATARCGSASTFSRARN